VAYITPEDRGVGCDFAGTVVYEALGYKKGDRVGGFVHGGAYKDIGAFAEYVKVAPHQLFRIPDNTTFEQAAAYPVPFVTAALALFQRLGLNTPSSGKTSDEFVLIYGGSSAVGVQAIQLAKLAGYKVVTTASPKNFDLLEKYGAEKCFDYNSSSVVEESCQYSLDCISETKTIEITSNALKSGGTVVLLLMESGKREDVKYEHILAYTVTGVKIEYGPFNLPAVPKDKAFAEEWFKVLTNFLKDGKIKESPLKKLPGGLDGVNDGFEYMSSGKVSGQKLVFAVKETKK
jgi:NADPH:quinone reductase-like Zn-dependent oxidoreductase